MWVVTVFHNINDIQIFEYNDQASARAKVANLSNAILSFTN